MGNSLRWSYLDERRHALEQSLDRLVDIFDFPLAPTWHTIGSLSPATRKYSTWTPADTCTRTDGDISSRPQDTIDGTFDQQLKPSMTERVRELLLGSIRSEPFNKSTRVSTTVWQQVDGE